MKILHITPNLSPDGGGMPRVVNDMTKALVAKGVEVLILTAAEKGKEEEIFRPEDVNVRIFKTGFLRLSITTGRGFYPLSIEYLLGNMFNNLCINVKFCKRYLPGRGLLQNNFFKILYVWLGFT